MFNLTYIFLKTLPQAVCVLNAQDRVIFANQTYKNLVLCPDITVFEFLIISKEDVENLYYLKNKALKDGKASGVVRDYSVTVTTKGKYTIWFLNKIETKVNQLDLEHLPVPAIAIGYNKSITASNSLSQDLFCNNKEILESFLEKLDLDNPSTELSFDDKTLKIFIKYNDAKEAVLVFIENTKEKALEREIYHSKKMQAVGELAGGIAHDFNNILTTIMMSCDFLLASHRTSDPSHPDLLAIKQNTNRAANLVQQLLAFSRRQTLQMEICNVADIVSDTKALMDRMMGNNIKLLMHYTHDVWQTKLDKNSLQRVLVNLLINAKDAIGYKEGIIELFIKNYTETNRNYVVITVKDNGPGIDEAIKDKLFEPFFTTKEVGKGTGLGLAMSYGIINQHGGFITCHSSVGEGAEFSIFLPAIDEYIMTAAFAPPAEAVTKLEDVSGEATILLVDDEETVRKICARALSARGYNILEAANGEQALSIYNEQKDNIDLIISDVIMPVMDGPSFYAEVQKIDERVKFVFISGYTRESFAEKYNLSINNFYYLAKPISLKDLALKIKEVQEI